MGRRTLLKPFFEALWPCGAFKAGPQERDMNRLLK